VANIGNIRLLNLEVKLKEKIYLFVNSTIQRCPKQIINCSVADPGCLSRIPDPDFYPSRIPDPKTATK
jgi:hypothetical protein